MSNPCNHPVNIGASSRRWERCGLPEDHVLHDPLGPGGRHVYDPVPALPEDES